MSSLSDAIPCLQSTCRIWGLIGESGRDAARTEKTIRSCSAFKEENIKGGHDSATWHISSSCKTSLQERAARMVCEGAQKFSTWCASPCSDALPTKAHRLKRLKRLARTVLQHLELVLATAQYHTTTRTSAPSLPHIPLKGKHTRSRHTHHRAIPGCGAR